MSSPLFDNWQPRQPFLNSDQNLVAQAVNAKVPAYDSAFSPLSKLAGSTTKWAYQRDIAAPTSGGAITLFSDVGQGIVKAIWITLDAGSIGLDGRLQITTDGGSTPDIDIDLGTLFLLNNLGSYGAFGSTSHWHGEMQASTSRVSGVLRFPIPYSSSVIVKLYNPSDSVGNNTVWSQVIYEDSTTAPYRLKSQGINWASAPTVSHSSAYNFFDITPGSNGWLVWFGLTQIASGSSSYTYLERNISVTADGNAFIESSGGEDFFLNSFYYQGRTTGSAPWASFTGANNANYSANAGLDLLELCGGVPFASELKMDLATEALDTADVKLSYVALYYLAM